MTHGPVPRLHLQAAGLLLAGSAEIAAEEALRVLDEDPEMGEALLVEMADRGMDLQPAVVALATRIPGERLAGWIRAAVPDPARLADLLTRI